MLSLQCISKTFNKGTLNERQALHNVNLSVEPGEFLILVGGNGCGKSTIMNVVSGMFPLDAGRILLGERDITSLPEHRRASYIGRVFQDPVMGTASGMSVADNLALAMRRGKRRTLRRGITKAEKRQYKTLLADLELGLEDRLSTKVGLLSGGQRQALTLLMATLQKPDILLLDEHTAALDPKTAAKVLQLTESLVRKNGLTTLMVTHNMQDAISYGDRLVMMAEGRVVYDVEGKKKDNLTAEELTRRFVRPLISVAG